MKIDIDVIKSVLKMRTGGEIARKIGVARTMIRRYQIGESSVENMTVGMALKIMEYAKEVEIDEMVEYEYSVTTIEYWYNEDYNEHWEREVILTESADTRFDAKDDADAIEYVKKYVGNNLGAIKRALNNSRIKNAIVRVDKPIDFDKYGEPKDFEEIYEVRFGFEDEE